MSANTATSDPSTKKRAVRVPSAPRAEICSASRLPCLMGGPSCSSPRSARRPKPLVAANLSDSAYANCRRPQVPSARPNHVPSFGIARPTPNEK